MNFHQEFHVDDLVPEFGVMVPTHGHQVFDHILPICSTHPAGVDVVDVHGASTTAWDFTGNEVFSPEVEEVQIKPDVKLHR